MTTIAPSPAAGPTLVVISSADRNPDVHYDPVSPLLARLTRHGIRTVRHVLPGATALPEAVLQAWGLIWRSLQGTPVILFDDLPLETVRILSRRSTLRPLAGCRVLIWGVQLFLPRGYGLRGLPGTAQAHQVEAAALPAAVCLALGRGDLLLAPDEAPTLPSTLPAPQRAGALLRASWTTDTDRPVSRTTPLLGLLAAGVWGTDPARELGIPPRAITAPRAEEQQAPGRDADGFLFRRGGRQRTDALTALVAHAPADRLATAGPWIASLLGLGLEADLVDTVGSALAHATDLPTLQRALSVTLDEGFRRRPVVWRRTMANLGLLSQLQSLAALGQSCPPLGAPWDGLLAAYHAFAERRRAAHRTLVHTIFPADGLIDVRRCRQMSPQSLERDAALLMHPTLLGEGWLAGALPDLTVNLRLLPVALTSSELHWEGIADLAVAAVLAQQDGLSVLQALPAPDDAGRWMADAGPHDDRRRRLWWRHRLWGRIHGRAVRTLPRTETVFAQWVDTLRRVGHLTPLRQAIRDVSSLPGIPAAVGEAALLYYARGGRESLLLDVGSSLPVSQAGDAVLLAMQEAEARYGIALPQEHEPRLAHLHALRAHLRQVTADVAAGPHRGMVRPASR